MAEYTIACNDRTTFYELHAPGCKHLVRRHIEQMGEQAGDNPAVAAAAFEAANEDCRVVVANCAKRL